MSDPSLTVITPYGRTGPSSRVRVFDWLDHFGLDAKSSSYIGTADHKAATLFRRPLAVASAEVHLRVHARSSLGPVLLSRNVSPFSRGVVEQRLLRGGSPGIYDFDDALYAMRSGPFPKCRIWHRCVLSADTIIAGNETLANRASEFSGNVAIVPSCVDPASYTLKELYELSDPPTAVWIGSPSTERHLLRITDALLRLNRQLGLRVKVLSSGSSDLGRLGPIAERHRWDLKSFAKHLVEADMGIAPLEDSEFTRGKCSYKLLQYAATGLPIIGDAVGTNRDVLRSLGGIGTDSTEDWVEGMHQLLNLSCSERRDMGLYARMRTEALFSFTAWAPTWAALVLGL